ncbi:MAG TPA: hypothetical protein VM327_03280 [Candidatus Thermoplasmatota archaeon]|nr:hypothetical protein [Candidatus Thermoplasmatota archaeon]
MRVLLVAAGAALLVAVLSPSAAGHEAPPPRAFETRILHDHNDDSVIVLAGKHGFDAIALDVREARLSTGEDALVLRLLLNGGCNANAPSDCPTLREVVRFKGPSGPQQVAFETADGGVTWMGNAASYVGPEPLNDGTRFAVEAWVPYSSFGGAEGAALEDWFVEGYGGGQSADDMPAGAVPGLPDPLGAAFDIGAYALGSRKYVSLAAEAVAPKGSPGSVVDVSVKVANLVPLGQNATFNVTGPAVLLSGEAPVSMLSLAPNFTADITLRITLPNGTMPVGLTVATTLGGFSHLAFTPVGTVPEPAIAENTTQGYHDPEHKKKDTPSPGAMVLLAGILAGAVVLRRRR